MGRYYDGDIEGKFWFAIQSSDDGEHFGSEECDSNVIEYRQDREVFEDIGKKQIKQLHKNLAFKHKIHNGNGRKWVDYDYYTLWQEWDNWATEWARQHHDTPEQFRYMNFQNWLFKFKQIGKEQPNIEDKDAYQENEAKWMPIWEWIARLHMGYKMQKFFDDNPDADELYYTAEC